MWAHDTLARVDDGISIFGSTSRIGGPAEAPLSTPAEFDVPDSAVLTPESYSDSIGRRPLKHATAISQIENHKWLREEWYDYSRIEEDCQQYSDDAIWLGCRAPIFSQVSELCGIQTALMNLRRRPNIVHAIIRNIVDFYSIIYEESIKAARGRLDLVGYGDDFASQQDLMMSPETWRTFFKAPLARLFQIAKNGAKTIFHSSGAVQG